MTGDLQDRVMIFDNYADGCPGIITSETHPIRPSKWLLLRCAECGRVVGDIEAGALEQLIELAEKGGAKKP